MNENVKIKITEIDTTSPGGRGTDSTDIAFVPGFSCLTTAPVNEPILCTNLRDFEKTFGTKPVSLTLNDVTGYTGYGFRSGQYDTGYVFAKELLCQGLSVVYCNVGAKLDTLGITFKSIDTINPKVTFDCSSDTSETTIEGTLNNSFADTISFTGVVERDITGNSSFEIDGALTSGADFAELKSISITKSLTDTSDVEVVCNGSSIEMISDVAAKVVLDVCVTVDVNGRSGDTFKLTLFENKSSRLDVFYKSVDGKLAIEDTFNTIADKSIYSVKYITSGGYPSILDNNDGTATNMFAYKMLEAAATRGDAVALIDYQMDTTATPFATDSTTGNESYYEKMQSLFTETTDNTEFGAAMYPWATYTCTNSLSFKGSAGTLIEMPASFAYLMCLAKAIKNSPNWLAMAGVSRGLVPGIRTLSVKNGVISNAVAENMQPKFGTDENYLSINCITDIKPYGLTIWGNRTLKPVGQDGAVALNFLNTRNMLSDIKKLLYTTAKSLMFEQNTESLWLRFKSGVSPLLNELKSGNGISDFKIIKGKTKYNGDPLQKGEVSAIIKIYPVYAVEYFELTVEISDEDVVVS